MTISKPISHWLVSGSFVFVNFTNNAIHTDVSSLVSYAKNCFLILKYAIILISQYTNNM